MSAVSFAGMSVCCFLKMCLQLSETKGSTMGDVVRLVGCADTLSRWESDADGEDDCLSVGIIVRDENASRSN